jgi:hypothetical protein
MLNTVERHIACLEQIYVALLDYEIPWPRFRDAYVEATRTHIRNSQDTRPEHRFEDRFVHAFQLAGVTQKLQASDLARHQLNVALRRAPRRLRLRGSDRILLVWMTRLWPSLLGLAQIVQPDTIPRTIGLTTPRRCEGHCTRRSAALRPKAPYTRATFSPIVAISMTLPSA